MTEPPTSDRDAIAAVLGRTPSGLFILTARGPDGQETGMLGSWVQQASFEPPAVTVAVNRKRFLNDWLRAGTSVVLNLVGESQKRFLAHFSKGFEPGVPAFDGLNVVRTQRGSPALADALGWMEGTIAASVDAGDHAVYVLHIVEAAQGATLDTEQPWVHVRKNGFGY